ncbi:MAG: hypothetical protein WCW17_02685 [Patescibacteria group bacterium]
MDFNPLNNQNNPPIQNKSSLSKKIYVEELKRRIFFISLIFTALLCLGLIVFSILKLQDLKKTKNTATDQAQTSADITKYQSIIIQKNNKDYIAFSLTAGWVSEPFFPSGTGTPIFVFASENDKKLATNIASGKITGDSQFTGVRYINGTIIVTEDNIFSDANQKKFQEVITKKPDFDRMINKNFNNAKESRCWQTKQATNLVLYCQILQKKGDLLEYSLETNETNYTTDLETYYKLIETTDIIK